MVLASDILRSANALIRQYEEEASIFAAMEADARLDAGDMDAYMTWRRILAAIAELSRTEPEDDDARH